MDEHILSLSYGKDSIACLEAIRLLGLPLDRIVHAEIWATDTISADLPPMVEFKSRADRIIKERYGIKVEHICAMRNGEKLTYEKMFYHVPKRRERETIGTVCQKDFQCRQVLTARNSNSTHFTQGDCQGWATRTMPYCTGSLKTKPLEATFGISNAKRKLVYQQSQNRRFHQSPLAQRAKK